MQTWTPQRVIWVAAVAAALSRFPGLLHPPYPDEAGYLYVAQHWDPSATSVFGPYFVDRSPILIAVFRLGDLLGGTPAIRVLAALGCGVLVLAAAGLAREITREDRWAAWTAVAAAVVTGSVAIEPVNAKGEVLGIPLVLVSMWLALVAVRTRMSWPALGAGLLAMTAVGLKQNLISGLVFGAILLLASALTGRLERRAAARLGAVAALGAAVPVLAVVVWAEAAGVSLHALWYAVTGFRGDAARVLADGGDPYPGGRAVDLVARACWGGLAPLALLFLVRVRAAWRGDRAVVAAAVALLLTDGPLLALAGSWWPSYLFQLVPGTVVFVALLLREGGRTRRAAQVLTAYAGLVAVAGAGYWGFQLAHPTRHDDPWSTGLGIGAAAEPGDSIVAPGRPDTTAASGLEAPYPYLWPLIQVTLDPDQTELTTLLTNPAAPTWFVLQPPLSDDPGAEQLLSVVTQHYVPAGTSCAGTPIYLRRGLQRPDVVPDCNRTGY